MEKRKKKEEKMKIRKQKIENQHQIGLYNAATFLDQPTWNHQHQSDGIWLGKRFRSATEMLTRFLGLCMTLVLGPSMTLVHGMPLNVTTCVGRRGRLLLSPAIDVSARETERGPTRHFMETLIKFRCSLEWCTCIEGSNQFSLAVRFGKLQGIAA